MKNMKSLFLCLSLMAVFFVACDKENIEVQEEIVVMEEEATDARMGGPVLVGPDLVITRINTNLPTNSTCPGGNRPSAVCGSVGGSTAFTMTLRITNIGNTPVPANQPFVISYDLDIGGLAALETFANTAGIPAGGSVFVTKNLAYPCPTAGPPFALVVRETVMKLDVFNAIAETKENNNSNAGRPYEICDDF